MRLRRESLSAGTRRLASGFLALMLLPAANSIVVADVVTLYIDGTDRAVDSTTRGRDGRAAWRAAVDAKGAAVSTDDFNGANIDVPVDTETSVGNFSVYFEQTGGYSSQAGNTAPDPHPTGIFVGTTGTGGGENAETIDGLELRYETNGPVTHLLELRFDPPILGWAADVYSVDGLGFGESGTPESNDHTTMHLGPHSFDLTELFEYSGSGYMSFFGIVTDVPFSSIRITAEGDGDRFRLDNVSIAE